MAENTSTASEAALRVYEPSASDATPFMVPFSTTDAKGIPSPVEASVTTPCTSLFWANAQSDTNADKAVRNSFAFFISIYIN